METAREKFYLYNTMSGIVAGLKNEYTTIDLRNEALVYGKIIEVDGNMNIEMEDVTFYDPRGRDLAYSNFFITSRTIRHIHIPKHLSAIELFEKHTNQSRRVKNKKVHTFKKSRAQKYQKAILEEAFTGE